MQGFCLRCPEAILAAKTEEIFQGTRDKEVLGTVLSGKKILWSLQPYVSLGHNFTIFIAS